MAAASIRMVAVQAGRSLLLTPQAQHSERQLIQRGGAKQRKEAVAGHAQQGALGAVEFDARALYGPLACRMQGRGKAGG
jgi:hypothetical protein